MPTFRFERGRLAALSVLLGAAFAACADTPSSPSATVPTTSQSRMRAAGGRLAEPNGYAYGLVKCQRPGLVQRSVLDTIAAVELQPHGLRFALPVRLAIDVRECSVREDQHPVLLYLDDDGEVRETLPGDLDEDAESFFSRIVHFSVYAVGV